MAAWSSMPANEPRLYLNPVDVAAPILTERLDYVHQIKVL